MSDERVPALREVAGEAPMKAEIEALQAEQLAARCEAAGRDERLADGQLYLDAAAMLHRHAVLLALEQDDSLRSNLERIANEHPNPHDARWIRGASSAIDIYRRRLGDAPAVSHGEPQEP